MHFEEIRAHKRQRIDTEAFCCMVAMEPEGVCVNYCDCDCNNRDIVVNLKETKRLVSELEIALHRVIDESNQLRSLNTALRARVAAVGRG